MLHQNSFDMSDNSLEMYIHNMAFMKMLLLFI